MQIFLNDFLKNNDSEEEDEDEDEDDSQDSQVNSTYFNIFSSK